MTEAQLSEIEKRAKVAGWWCHACDDDVPGEECTCRDMFEANSMLRTTDVPAIIAEVRRLQERIEDLEQAASGNNERGDLLVAKYGGNPYDEVRRLRAERDEQAFHHAACLSIAEGAPDWQSFESKYPAAEAVKTLRAKYEKFRAAIERHKAKTLFADGHSICRERELWAVLE